jgi:DNA-binding NarL/FixJ family response regulator
VEKIRVLIVDDRPIFRAGARGMLGEYAHISVVGEATNGGEAVQKARSLKPDVILMDISMPEMDGIRATEEIMKEGGRVAIVGLTVSDHEEDITAMLLAGATGYILKDSGPQDLARAIEDAHAGRTALDRAVVSKMVTRLATSRPPKHTLDLSPREKGVLSLVIRGYPNKAIAGALGISQSTVKAHLRQIFDKMDVDSRAAAAARAVQLQLDLD